MSRTAERLLAAIARLGVVTKANALRTAQPLGLAPTQAQALVLLHIRGPMRAGALADAMAVRAPTVTDVLAVLEAKGLIERTSDPADGRASLACVTLAGGERAEALSAWPDDLVDAVEVLDAEEQGVMLRALSKVIVRLQERGRIDVARVCLTCRYFRPRIHDDPFAPHHCDFVDGPFGDLDLRIHCPDHQPGVKP